MGESEEEEELEEPLEDPAAPEVPGVDLPPAGEVAALQRWADFRDGPLADYQTDGVDDERLSGGLAGVLGVLLVLVLMGGLAWLLRRRGPVEERPAQRSEAGLYSEPSPRRIQRCPATPVQGQVASAVPGAGEGACRHCPDSVDTRDSTVSPVPTMR